MKKFWGLVVIFFITIGFASCNNIDNDNDNDIPQVSVVQSVAVPGGYAPLDNASLPAENFQTYGNIKLRYDFTVNSKKDSEKALIAMNIHFPNEILSSWDTTSTTCRFGETKLGMKFYIPQQKFGACSIGFELNIPDSLYDKELPIPISFEYYKVKKNNNDNWWEKSKDDIFYFTLSGAVIGAVGGAGIGAIPGALLFGGMGCVIYYLAHLLGSEPEGPAPSSMEIMSESPKKTWESEKKFTVRLFSVS